MKKIIPLLLTYICASITMYGQIVCGYKSYSVQTISQPSTCLQFLNDFTPSDDSTLIVNVNLYICRPSTVTPGSWTGSTLGNAEYMIDQVNLKYANMGAAHLYFGAAFRPDAKIKFAIKTFTNLVSATLYSNVCSPGVAASYADPNAISVFFGTDPIAPAPAGYSGNNIIWFSDSSSKNIAADGFAMAHELGHALGLNHTVISDSYSAIFPYEGCCTQISAEDYRLEDSTVWTVFGPCIPTSTANSNNIMAYNLGCRNYFSPQQMAIMHYNLRASQHNLLTGYSYNNHLKVDPAYDYTVATSTTWSNDRHFKGNIIVPAGVKLTISCLVSMSAEARFIVKKGGWLSVEGGTITNISGHMWNGIQVEGNAALDQSIGTGGFANNQGLLDIGYGSVITNAGTGAMNYVTDNNGNIDWASPGGIIRGYGASFVNNSRDVEFLSSSLHTSASEFKFCDFKTTGLLNDGLLPFAHVSLWDVRNVQFLGCNFENSAPTLYTSSTQGIGILSMDADYVVKRYYDSGSIPAHNYPGKASNFSNLSRGIWVANLTPIRAPYIIHSDFYDNTLDAIYMHNAWNFTIDNNFIRTPSMGNGIYLNNSRLYTVKNNTLTENGSGQSSTGIYAWQSQGGAHQIYRNTFSGLAAGILAEDNNSGYNNTQDGLKINCNNFSAGNNLYDIAMLGFGSGLNAPTVMRKQGASGLAASATNLVRNLYGAFCSNQNKWYASGAGTSTLIIEHGTNSGTTAVTQPTPQPACSNTIVNVIPVPISLNYTVHCLAYPPSGVGMMEQSNLSETMGNLNEYMAELTGQGEDADLFELETTMSSQLSCLARDTAAAASDSIVSLIRRNPGQLPDTDLQLIFAYMHKSDYLTADSLAGNLDSSREYWKNLLRPVISMYQDSAKLYSLNTNTAYIALMEDYAGDDIYRDGAGMAQALLMYVRNTPYTQPWHLPESETESERRARQTETFISSDMKHIWAYPNPTQSIVNIIYASGPDDQVLIEISDLLGRVIYTNFISGTGELELDLGAYSNGVYILTAAKHKKIIYSTKLIKQE